MFSFILGTGYHMILSLSSISDRTAITNMVTSIIPEAIIQNESASQITYNLPTSKCNSFSNLFLQLETETNFGICGIGLSCTTMEDVFLKYGNNLIIFNCLI